MLSGTGTVDFCDGPSTGDLANARARPEWAAQIGMPLRGTSKDENRGRSPVEPGNVTGAGEPVARIGAGASGHQQLSPRARVSESSNAEAPWAATPGRSVGRASRWTCWLIGARGWTYTR